METKRFAYAFVGLRPSERQEIAELLTSAGADKVHLRLAGAGEHPDFWVINGDEPEAACRLQTDTAPVIAVGGDASCMARVERPFRLKQAQSVLSKLLSELPDTHRAAPTVSSTSEESAFSLLEPWGAVGAGDSSYSEYGSNLELTPSELAMTEDDPPDLLMLRRAAHDRRMSSHTLEPTDMSETIGQEWLDLLPAQILVVAELGQRTRTLPKGLRKMGFGVDVVDGLERALKLLADKEYRVVFLEQLDGSSDTVRWCKAFLAAKNVNGAVPHVAIIARRKSTMERWRVKRAGCAAWMLVPLDRKRLFAFLSECRVERSLPRED